MGGKKKGGGSHNFGRALIKDRFGRGNKTLNSDSFLHTSDLADGYDWGRLNLQSVTEQSSFEEFLSTAELAGTEFTAEKLNVEFVPESRMVGTLTDEERSKIEKSHKEFKHFIKIPRRPAWDNNTTAEDLESKERQNFLEWRQKYSKEVDKNKTNLLLLNKSDLLTAQQRKYWAKYFDSIAITVAFYSAKQSEETIKEGNEDADETVDECPKFKNSSKLLTKEELISLFKTIHGDNKRLNNDLVTIGLVGYPNVGKSSTINTLLVNKKVSVSSTPGKTKHFQVVNDPNDTYNMPPVNIICSQIPKHILEDQFSIMVTKPLEGEDPNRPPTADEFLNAYACSRGYMTANGQPDGSRAARVILKHYVNGRLLFCIAPPGVDQTKFHSYPPPEENRTIKTFTPFENILLKPNVASGSDLDNTFFKKTTMGAHSKGMKKMDIMGSINNQAQQSTSKPWKNHKEKRNKHEKLRRQFRHLDI
ncbi:hypothetical protein ACI65C_003836 [Semiaphis heraclei]